MDSAKPNLKFVEVNHTADIQIIVYGRSLEELFLHAGEGLYHIIGAQASRQLCEQKKIELIEDDLETLLVVYLEELLFLADQKLMVVNPKLGINNTTLSGELPLAILEKMSIEVKAVTYHEMKVSYRGGTYQTKITFDI